MALTLAGFDGWPGELRHVSKNISDGSDTTLITGVVGKRIRIWQLILAPAAFNKSCVLKSGTDKFIAAFVYTPPETLIAGNIPLFTCNAGDDFKADPSDTTSWDFYIVYTIS